MQNMQQLGMAWPVAVMLLSLRLGTTLAMTPVLAPASVPLVIRALLVLALSAALSLGLPGGAPAPQVLARGLGGLLEGAGLEVALGATLGLGIHLAFAAFTMAGQLLGIQMGFGLAQVLDPATRSNLPVVASAFNQVALVGFFLVDGHHALLRGVAFGLERFPLGAPWPIGGAALPVLAQLTGLFGLGFALAAPVVFCLLMVEGALGIVARNLPQMNMILMGIPVKVVVGLAALALWLGGMGDAMGRVYGGIFRTWEAIFAAADPEAPLDGQPPSPSPAPGGGGR